MKFWDAPPTVLKNSWDQVAQSYFQRYPNPFSKHVLTEDTVVRHIDGGQLRSVRILTKTGSGMPRWAERFVPTKMVTVVEESVVDPVSRTLTTYTRNIGYHNRIVRITERAEYRQDPADSSHTVVSRQAWVESPFHISSLRRPIEAFILERYRKNCSRALEGLSWVLSGAWRNSQSRDGLNDMALEAARRATEQIHSRTKVGLSS